MKLMIMSPENNTITDVLCQWCNLIERPKNNDVWTVLPELPQYKFKNLYIKNAPFETCGDINDLNITFVYDVFEKIKI